MYQFGSQRKIIYSIHRIRFGKVRVKCVNIQQKRQQIEMQKVSNKNANNPVLSKFGISTDKKIQVQNNVQHINTDSNQSQIAIFNKNSLDKTQDNQIQLQQNNKIGISQNNSNKTDQKDGVQTNQHLEESCLIFQENMISKRMASSISKDEDLQKNLNKSQIKQTVKNQSNSNDQFIPIQLKFSMERDKIYEQNLKLLKQSPNTLEKSQEQIMNSYTTQQINCQSQEFVQQQIPQKQEQDKPSPQIAAQISPRIDLLPIYQVTNCQNDQSNHNNQNNCTTIPSLTTKTVNTPSFQTINQEKTQQQTLNTTTIQSHFMHDNNIENNTKSFKLTPTKISNIQQIPQINSNIITNNISTGSNTQSNTTLSNSNGNTIQQLQYPYQHENDKYDASKKQINELILQYNNIHNQQYYNASPDNSLSKFQFTSTQNTQTSPVNNHIKSDYASQNENQHDQIPTQQFPKIIYSGETSSTKKTNNIASIQTSQNQEQVSSDTQKWNNVSSNLLRANSIDIDNNNISLNGSGQKQCTSTSKKLQQKPYKVPSDDTYIYLQTLFETDENNDSQQSKLKILLNSNHLTSYNNYAERDKYTDDIVAASFSSINSNSSNSLKYIRSLSSAIDDENIMAEKSKQKLKEKQLIYLNKEFSQSKKVQSLELKDDQNKLDPSQYSQSSYIRQKNIANTISESGEANPVFANFASKKRLSLILQQNMNQKNDEFQQENYTQKNKFEYETCSSLDINDQ